MPFVTFPEREGLLRGRREALAVALELKFGAEGLALMPAFHQAFDDEELLLPVIEAVITAGTLDEVRKLLPAQPDASPASE